MANVSRYVSGLLFFGILACLLIPTSAESISFGYQPDPIQFTETGNSYILNNSEMEIEFFKDTAGYNQYRNARNDSVLIYDARIWVDYLGPGDKWKPAGIPQTTSYRQIYKGYEVTRHYTGIQADYDVVYTWIENRPIKYTVFITGKVEDDFQVAWSLDGVVGTSKIEKKSIYAGNNHNLIISIQDIIKLFGDDSVVVTESTSANGKKFDYTFGSWELNFSDMANGSHKIQIDPSVTFNGSNSWAGTTLVNMTQDISGENIVVGTMYETWNDGTNTEWPETGDFVDSSNGYLEVNALQFAVNYANYSVPIPGNTDYIFTNTFNITDIGGVVGSRLYIGVNNNSGSTYELNFYWRDNGEININDYDGTVLDSDNIVMITDTDFDLIFEKIGSIINVSVYYSSNGTLLSALSGTTSFPEYDSYVRFKTYYMKATWDDVVYNENRFNFGYVQINYTQDAGANQVWKHWHVEGTDPSDNTSLAIQANVSSDNSSFSWVWINLSCNVGDNVTASVANEYRYLGSPAARYYSNTTWVRETNIISNITITSGGSSLLPPQNLTNITEQTQICYNWDDYASADKWNISQRIPSIPYTDVVIVLDGVKDAEFTDRAHTWILDSPNPTGTNGDKESISWIRNTTTLSGYADGEDDDILPNDDSFTFMIDMTANNLTTDDRQFILSESGTVTAKRWGGAAWLPQATNAVGVVIGAGVAGDIQYEMQIPISELSSFNNGSTIKLAMAREDTSQNPDVTKYYPKTLINDTDATVWTLINLSAECEFTFLGNTTLSNYTVIGLTSFTWYRHRFSTINGSSESSYVYSNDITEDSPQYTVSGYILTESGSPVSGATVWSVCDCGCVCEVNISNATGFYQGDCFYNGTYTIYASKTDYNTNSISIVVNGANQSNINITLSLSPINVWTSIVDSVAWGISVAQYLVSNIGIVITTAFSLICILILMMLIGAALSVTNIIYR